MIYSLEMEIERVDGRYVIAAPWLDEPVVADSFEAAYEAALLARAKRTKAR